MKNLKLSLEINKSIPQKIESDKKRLKQILFNLIGNAIKFTFKGFIKIVVNYNDPCIVIDV